MKQKEISNNGYLRLRSTASKQAKLCGLPMINKKTPLRPVLSLTGSNYENLNRCLAQTTGRKQ